MKSKTDSLRHTAVGEAVPRWDSAEKERVPHNNKANTISVPQTLISVPMRSSLFTEIYSSLN
ncbi:hypothetical protein Lal_00020484 [Lupinus albus]|nr:hypothetical protein Lal_00020484 [Lupinus albus]